MNCGDEFRFKTNNVKLMAKHAYDKYMRLNTVHLGIADVIEAMFQEAPIETKIEMLHLVEEMYLQDRLYLN